MGHRHSVTYNVQSDFQVTLSQVYLFPIHRNFRAQWFIVLEQVVVAVAINSDCIADASGRPGKIGLCVAINAAAIQLVEGCWLNLVSNYLPCEQVIETHYNIN